MKLCMGCMNQIEDQLVTCPHCGFNETTLRQESYYLDPGTVVGGKYIVGKVLNYGGHTISYLGYDAENNRKVAIKEYLPSDFSTRSEGENEVTIYSGDAREQFEQGLTNFLNEANRIQQLGQPEGIAWVYDCVAENDTGYVISEYIEGQTLKEILDSGKKYDAEEAKNFIQILLGGLSKVHPLDIVHCDIAPETIMVTVNGEIKLLDFGATRYVTTANSKSLAIILKQGYAPEEQYRSQGVRGPWTDVYAVAAVMYRMLTGVVPQESVERALVDDLKEPSKMGVSIPENVENALMNALNIYKDERTQSAEVFLQELSSASVKRLKVKKRRNEIGKFPLWAKCLVAGLLVVVVVGGVALFRISNTGNGELTSSDIILQSMETKTLEEAEEYFAELNETNGWNIEITPVYVYNSDESLHGKISGQEGLEDSFNFSSFLQNYGTEEAAEDNGLTVKEDAISGTITYEVYRNDAMYYKEISGLNAYTLAEKIGIDKNNKTVFVPDEETAGKSYYDLKKIVTAQGEISAEELLSEANADQELKRDDIKQLEYYASEFFYWDSLDDFVGKKVNELPNCKVYRMKNEKQKEEKGEMALSGTLIDQSYIALKTYSQGYIFAQTVAPGEKLDLHIDMDKLQDGILLRAIEQVISYEGRTGNEFATMIAWENVEIEWTGSGDKSQKVLDVQVKNQDTGENVSVFKRTDNLKFIIKLAEKPKKPVQTKPAAPSTPAPSTPEPSTPTPSTPAPEPAAPSGGDSHSM